MKYGGLILILLILFISVLYIKKNVSRFICACDKEDFTDKILTNIPGPPELIKFNDFIQTFKKNFIGATSTLLDKKTLLQDDGTQAGVQQLKLIDETINLINTLGVSDPSPTTPPTSTPVTTAAPTTTSTPSTDTVVATTAQPFRRKHSWESQTCYDYVKKTPLKGCMLRDDGKIRSNGRFVDPPSGDGPRRCDNLFASGLRKTVEHTKGWDEKCAWDTPRDSDGNVNPNRKSTTKSECEDISSDKFRCSWEGFADKVETGSSVEGFADKEYFTTNNTPEPDNTSSDKEYKTIIAVIKNLGLIFPERNTAFETGLQTFSKENTYADDYCSWWNFFQDLDIVQNKFMEASGFGSICMRWNKIQNKTFFNGPTSLFNFSSEKLENTAPTIALTTSTVFDKPQTKKSCSDPNKDIANLDMDKYVLKTEMTPPADMSLYVKKSALKNLKIDKSKYILKSKIPSPARIPDPNKYILKTELKPPPKQKQSLYKGYNIAGGPLDMTTDYSLYPTKSRFSTCDYAKVGKKNYKKKPTKDDNNNEYNPNRLSQCKAQRNINTPDIFAR